MFFSVLDELNPITYVSPVICANISKKDIARDCSEIKLWIFTDQNDKSFFTSS